MAGPLSLFPLEKEDEIVDAIQLAKKPLYIRSKDSEVHVGTKFVIEIQNENDIEKLQPLIASLGQSFSDLSPNNKITTEVKGKQSVCNKSLENGNEFKSDVINTSQNSSDSCGKLLADSTMPEGETKITSPDSAKSDGSLLLTPEFFYGGYKQFENVKFADMPSRFNFKTETAADSITSSNFPVSSHAESKQLKLIMPMQSAWSNQYCDKSSMPYQQKSIATAQNQYPHNLQWYKTDFSDGLMIPGGSMNYHFAECIPNSSIRNHSDYFSSPYVSNQIDHTASTVLHGSQICSPPHRLDNFSRVRIIDKPAIKSNTKETNDHWKSLDRNYMEERNFMLQISPGVFYDTPHGILVEMKNGCQYEVILVNNNNEACDVDLYVDTKLVYRVRLNAYDRTVPLDGPIDSEKKFVFLRASDSPPEAGIINKHERNGQIKAVFKPKISDQLEERKRAWTVDSGAVYAQSLCETINNITGPSMLRSSHHEEGSGNRYRAASLCSGATALQGKQKKKCFEYAEYMKVDENRLVILQLRLVARLDDQSCPSTSDPITPLITKMPPPLPF